MANEKESGVEEVEAIPVDFRLEELRILAGDEFRVYIYKSIGGNYELQSKKSEIPDIDDVGREFGPGKYQIRVSFKKTDEKTKGKPWTFNTVTFTLGQPYAEINREYRKQLAENNGTSDVSAPAASSRLESLRELIELMSLMRGLMPQAPIIPSSSEALRDITPILTAALGRPLPERDDTIKILLPKLLEMAMPKQDQSALLTQMIDMLKTGMEMGSSGGKEEGGLSGILETLAPSLLAKFMDAPPHQLGGSAKVIEAEVTASKPRTIARKKSLVEDPAALANSLRNDPGKLKRVYEQVVSANGKEFADSLLKKWNLDLPGISDNKLNIEKQATRLSSLGRIKL